MKGQCLCGAVTIEAPDSFEVNACHCGMCRRWGGGPYLSVHCSADTQIAGVAQVATYRSSEWAERGFCRNCGTHLYYKLLATGELAMPAGLFQGAPMRFTEQIFIDHKPAYYSFANATSNLSEAEVFARFSAQQGGES